MVRIVADVIVELPRETVFDAASDPETHLQWETSTIKVIKVTVGPMGIGTKHQGSVRFLGQRINWESEVIEYQPNSRVEYGITAGSMQFKEKWNFEDVEQNTKVTFIFEGDLCGFLRLISPIAVWAWRRQAHKDLARMKTVLE